MTVDELMKQAFELPRDPRSPEYKAGCRALLDFKINRIAIERPYQFGTAQSDAFFAGIDEGHAIIRRTMNEYEIAVFVIVKQRGADASDAVDRALFNLRLRHGAELRNPEPSHCGDEAGPVIVVRAPEVIMVKSTP